MRFDAYLKRLRPSLDQAIADCVGVAAADLPEDLQQPLQRALTDGKRLRAGILCLVTETLGGSLTAALPRAAAIECIQAASLIHDDYVDADTMRRQRPATWTLLGARKAVLLGDLLFANAIERMMALSADDGRVIVHAIATVAKGAYQEPTAVADLAIDHAQTYDRIIYLKTGALFAAAAELGAIAAGAGDEHRAAARTLGARLGEAYQIGDDLQDFTAMRYTPAQRLPPPLIPALLRFARNSADMRSESADSGLDSTRLPLMLSEVCTDMQLARKDRAVAATEALASLPHNRMGLLLRVAVTEIAAGNQDLLRAPVNAGA